MRLTFDKSAPALLRTIFTFHHVGWTPPQGLSQDFETGCLKLAVVKFWGVQIFKGDYNILMYKFIKIRHDIIEQCHGNYEEMKTFNYKLKIEIFRNSTVKKLGVLRGSF